MAKRPLSPLAGIAHGKPVDIVRLVLPGPPPSKARARRGAYGRWYTPDSTKDREAELGQIWMVAGRPQISGPLLAEIHAYFKRPKTHYNKDGTLSAQGRRLREHTCKPDRDNIEKAVLDGLSGLAFGDDAYVIGGPGVNKHWAERGEEPRTEITLRPAATRSAAA